ncbi:MAG TPA: hypothetical protein VGS60_01175 [Actinomycetes bacterium]|jgi:hypothetical protein|nr:hypothetical protein [Actinomycetes bacterium]
MLGSLSGELLKLRKRPAIWLVGTVFVLLGVFAYVFPYLNFRRGGAEQDSRSAEELLQVALPGNLVPSALNSWPLLGGAAVLVLGRADHG